MEVRYVVVHVKQRGDDMIRSKGYNLKLCIITLSLKNVLLVRYSVNCNELSSKYIWPCHNIAV